MTPPTEDDTLVAVYRKLVQIGRRAPPGPEPEEAADVWNTSTAVVDPGLCKSQSEGQPSTPPARRPAA